MKKSKTIQRDAFNRSKRQVLTYFYLKQVAKAFLILVIGWMPMNETVDSLINLTRIKNINQQSLFIGQNTALMYSFASAVIFGIALYYVIFKMKWHYADYVKAKATHKADMAKLFHTQPVVTSKTDTTVRPTTKFGTKSTKPTSKK